MDIIDVEKTALEHLRKDPILKKIIDTYPIPNFERNDDLLLDILETIINQQLSSKAADTIFGKFRKLFVKKKIDAKNVLAISDEKLRKCGISFAKIHYIKGIAQATLDEQIDLKKLHDLPDDEVIKELTKLKGIGKWSAEMMLIFSLNRPDVFSCGDLGLCTAVSRLYNIDRKDLKTIERISLRWKPYRSFASWYLWRSLETSAKIK